MPLDVHLMIDDPDRWAPGYAEPGAASVTFHVEAATDRCASHASSRWAHGPVWPSGRRPRSSRLFDLLDEFDMILVMTVEPGFGGQSFMAETLPKIRRRREAAIDAWASTLDPGRRRRRRRTSSRRPTRGPTRFVAGSAVFGADDPVRDRGPRATARGTPLSPR